MVKDTSRGYSIGSYQPDSITINGQEYSGSLLLMADLLIAPWLVSKTDELTENHIQSLFSYQPQLVIIGTGSKLKFLNPRLMTLFGQNRVGLEMMTRDALCRTYTILMSEGRRILALFLKE